MRILIAGDSLTLPRPYRINEFNPENDKELAVHYHETYGSLLQKELNRLYPNKYFEVINRGQRAFTIKHVVNQIFDHVYYFQPNIFILHVGIVDLWFREELNGGQYVNLSSFEENVQKVIKIINSVQNMKLIIIGIAPTSLKMNKRYKNILLEISKYNNVYKKYVDFNQIFYIDLEKHIRPEDPHKYLLYDDHHLNREGNKLIFNKLKNLICAFLESDLGVEIFEHQRNMDIAIEHFKKSYMHYPYYLDNLYNLLTLLYENKKYDEINSIIKNIGNLKTKNHPINTLLSFFKDHAVVRD